MWPRPQISSPHKNHDFISARSLFPLTSPLPCCYDCTSWTIIFPSIPLFFSPLLYYGHPPFAPCYGLELDLLSDTKTGTRCLADCAPLPLSITCVTLTLTVLPTRASVPADVHLLCPSYARLSSLWPYVSLHHLCTLLDPPTCVTPCPLYML